MADEQQTEQLDTATNENHKGGRKKCRGKGMGTLLLKGKKYQARIWVNGKLYTKSTKTGVKKDAEKILQEFVADFQTKDELKLYDNLAHRAMTFQQQVDKATEDKPALAISSTWATYKAAQNRPDSGDRTLADYELQFGKFLDWMAAHHPDVHELRKVSQQIADEFASALGTTRTANTFNKYITLFRTMWSVLATTARLTTNPWLSIRKKKLTTHSKRELTIEELYRVVTTATGELQTLFSIGIYTGFRLGDCAMLEWGSIDLIRGYITITPRKTARRNNNKTISVPIHATLADTLINLPQGNHIGFVLPEIAALYMRNPSTLTRKIQSHFLACGISTGGKGARLYKNHGYYRIEHAELDKNGKHVVENTGLTDLAAARKVFADKIGCDKRAQIDVGFHSLRHTFVSLCANNKVPMALVQKIVGHSNPMMTAHYFHENQEEFKKAAAVLPDITTREERKALPAPATSRLDTFKTLVQTMTDAELQEARSFLASLN